MKNGRNQWRSALPWVAMALLACSLVPPAAADGPDTGTVTGKVVDAAGAPLPGVTVTLEGERGSLALITGADGVFRFASQVPGPYVLKAELEGFGAVEQAAQVSVGQRTDLTLTLGQTTETITVTSEAPMVDKYNVSAGASMEGETASEISATVRTFYGALQVLPGVTNDVESADLSQSRPTVNGSLWQESNVYVDGVDATYSMQGGGTRVFLPSSALAEVSMEAGGGGAEYGRNAGSHTNLITRSGTNTFHGDFGAVFSENSWNANYEPQDALAQDESLVRTFALKGAADPVEAARNFIVYQPGERDDGEVNVEASLGGPIKRDKAWFFLSRGEVSTNQIDKTLDGELFNVSSELFSSIVKLNFQPGARHSLAATFIDAPVDRVFLLPPMGDRYVASFFDIAGTVANLNWNYSISSNLFLETKLAQQVSDENPQRVFSPEQKAQDPLFQADPALGRHSPNNNDAVYVQAFDNTWHNGWVIGRGFGKNEFPREQFNLALTHFAAQNHELKYGLDLQQVRWDQDVARPNGYQVYEFETFTDFGAVNDCRGSAADPGAGGEDTRCFFRDFNPADVVAAGKGSSDSDGRNFAGYVRDRFDVAGRWTFNVGVRVENQVLENDRGRDVIDSTTVSPRASVVYDLKGDGRQLVTLSGGRFFTQTPQQLVNSNLQEDWNGVNANDLWLHGSSVSPALAGLPTDVACSVLAGLGLPVDTTASPYCFKLGSVRPGELWQFVDQGLIEVDIEPYHRDELVLGYEWQFSDNWALDAKGIWWRLDNLIGSTLQRDQNFDLFLLVENYDDYAGILRNLNFVENFVERGFGTAEQAESVLNSFEDDNRRYRGLQLQLNRRFNKGWALFNNVSLSKVEGKTYGGGNGANDLGAFDNLNDDYGRNLEVVLTDEILDSLDCSAAELPANCADRLRPFIGTPLSTINRQGELAVDRSLIFKSFGYKQWDLGRHSFNLGGLFVWQSGSPWQRTRSTSNPNVSLEDTAVNTTINTFLVPRGSFENDDFWWLNLSGAWSFPVGWNGRLNGQLRLEIANVTDEQAQVSTSDRTGAPLRSRRSFQQPQKIRVLTSLRF